MRLEDYEYEITLSAVSGKYEKYKIATDDIATVHLIKNSNLRDYGLMFEECRHLDSCKANEKPTVLKPKKNAIPFKWEPIGSCDARAKVFGGWLVCVGKDQPATFVPDPNHEWEVE